MACLRGDVRTRCWSMDVVPSPLVIENFGDRIGMPLSRAIEASVPSELEGAFGASGGFGGRRATVRSGGALDFWLLNRVAGFRHWFLDGGNCGLGRPCKVLQVLDSLYR